jgi:hypothetical protein
LRFYSVRTLSRRFAAGKGNSPVNDATDVNRTGTTLTWIAGSDAIDHLVYFGTANPPPRVAIVTMPTVTYDTGAMGQGRLYYWHVDANNSYGDPCAGDTWSFRVEECVNSAAPFYADWVGGGALPWSRPDCWCYKRQCRGDTDGSIQLDIYWVFTLDLPILKDAYGKADALLTGNRICADFNHAKQLGLYRVYTRDLSTLQTYYGQTESQLPVCPMDWDGDGDNDYNFWTN